MYSPFTDRSNKSRFFAKRCIVEVYEEAEKQGLGAVGMDGLVVDRPVYVRAQNLLDFMAQQTEDMKE